MPRTHGIPTAMLAIAALSLLAAAPSGAEGRWQPKPTTAPWQWQLQGALDTSIEAGVYEVDGFETPRRTVAKLHRLGRRAICYLDVGAWESYRPDAGRFPEKVLGNVYFGYPDERWLDIRRLDLLAPILRVRFEICRRKGFDAVEPDNLAGYENETGFPLSGNDQLRFNRWVSREVRRRGMAVALKNDPAQVEQLVGDFDSRGRGVLRLRGVRDVQPLRRCGQGGLHGRVRERAVQLLPRGQEAPLQHDQEGVRPLRQALAALRLAA